MPAPTRAQVIRWLATASSDERLGLFVGTGFSIAATNNLAPSFKKLLEQTARSFGLPANLDVAPFLQKSYPQIASQLLIELIKTGRSPEEANSLFRRSIASLCNLMPNEKQRERFETALKLAAPSWIITTNYDLILEALMEHGRSVLPNQSLFPSRTQVPIYHLHGHRYVPESIRITEEDYVSLLAPLDYQRLKLPLLFLESTTLLLGYALGDINVRAAMEWAQSFRGTKGLSLQPPHGVVVQALFTDAPSDQPRVGPGGEIILEINDIPDLLEEIGMESSQIDAYEEYEIQELRESLDVANAEKISEPGATRDQFLTVIEHSVGAVPVTNLIDFLSAARLPFGQKP
jgi:hypothetical protein